MRLIGLMALLAGFVSVMNAQAPDLPRDEATGKVVYTEVVNVPGTTADQLYKRLNHWFNTFYKNPGSVVEKRTEGQEIGGKHFVQVHDLLDGKKYPKGNVRYYISVQVKDGRYKFTVDDIYFYQTPKLYIEEWFDEKAANKDIQYGYLNEVKTFMDALVADLKRTMGNPLPEEKSDDW